MNMLQASVHAASPDAVIAAGARLGAAVVIYPFLESTNPLCDAAHKIVEATLLGPVSAPKQQLLAEYLVIAAAWHTLEGWRNLAQAALAMLNGARPTAVHLAYYAELRAARSILANSGICVRDYHHFGLDPSGVVMKFGARQGRKAPVANPSIMARIRKGLALIKGFQRSAGEDITQSERPIRTHVAAAEALSAWATTAANGGRVIGAMRGLRFRGVDWVEAIRSTSMRDSIAAEWLSNWSVDLRSLSRDHDQRKIASYGVSFNAKDFDPVREDDIRLVRAMNECSLSQDSGDVDALDLAVLRDFLIKAGRIVAESEGEHLPKRDHSRVWQRLREYLAGPGGMDMTEADDLVGSVRKAGKGSGAAVLKAAHTTNRTLPGVLARAFLLLRLATSLQLAQWDEMRLRSAQGKLAWPDEVVRSYAVHTHSAVPSIALNDLRDLEEDQIEAVEEMGEWLSSNPFDSLATWRDKSVLVQNLCRFERAFLVAAAS